MSSKIRIADGGQDLAALMAFGRADEAVGQTSAFATSVREATREMLVELGCAVGQGYCIARPMPVEDVISWMANWRPERMDNLRHREELEV